MLFAANKYTNNCVMLFSGYYRVNYDNVLWERIIEALDDPETREVIHPLNRATVSVISLYFIRNL